MNVELITIGDELLAGHTIDSNSAFIARELADAGFTVRYKSSVGDSLEEMEEAFRNALQRSTIIITTGGLGPTDDDLTKRAIVKVFKRNLIFLEDVLEDLKQRYAKRGIELPAINQNQALLPQGATFFPNKTGSAVGICIAEGGRVFISLPGVPYEMKQMITDEVVPYLSRTLGGHQVRITTLHTTGIIESRLAELVVAGYKTEPGVKLAYLPGFSGVDLRVTVRVEDVDEADKKLLNHTQKLERIAGKYIYGRDKDTLEDVVAQLLKDNDRTISVAESCTGGQLGMLLTSVPGSSAYFIGGIQAYHNNAKINLLGVSKELLDEHGAVSEECAVAMARGCRDRFETDYALSITGIAGPDGGTDDKPVGTTWIGFASRDTQFARKFKLGIHRDAVRSRACYSALETIRRQMLDLE